MSERQHIRRVEIQATRHEKGIIHIARQLPGRYPLWRWQHYPLTEKNYWRAVAMQLRLAGFVSLEAHKEKLFDEGYQFSL